MKLLLAMVVVGLNAAPAEDEVTQLPGWSGPLPSPHYSGYLASSETKKLHYYLVASEGDPAVDPVTLWFNGGPGCSSLDGFLYEHGPFRVAYSGGSSPTLSRFNYSWSRLTTMVYVEAPCGVGFSHSTADDPTADYQCTDDTAAEDNLAAVESLFAKFPEFRTRDLYLTGESYAGIYVPTLAEAILLKGEDYTGAPLKGIAVGNGCSGSEIGICAFGKNTQGAYYTTKFLTSSGFVPERLKDSLDEHCNYTAWAQGLPISVDCDATAHEIKDMTKKLDTYCVYCDCPPTNSRGSGQLLGAHSEGGLGTTACINTYEASAYLNQPEVQQALHVIDAGVSNWQVCGNAEGWSYQSTRPNLPRDTYPLLVSKIRVLIYNGDWDACVPYTDNEAWTLSMGFPIKKEWHPWLYADGDYQQVGGYATAFDVGGEFVFTTVRGGRHEVPETAPERAFAMLATFLSDSEF